MNKYSIIFEWSKYDSGHPDIYRTRKCHSFHDAVMIAVSELSNLNDGHLPSDYYRIRSITEVK